jgi:hypothetical protein
VSKKQLSGARDWISKPVTERQMLLWVRDYEKLYFSGRRIVLSVKIQPKFPDYASYGLFGVVDISDEVIRSPKLARILLLHELVHGKLFLDTRNSEITHGAKFQAEVKRLIRAGAYDNIL